MNLDINECDSVNMNNTCLTIMNSTCINTAGSYRCDCNSGYSMLNGQCKGNNIYRYIYIYSNRYV